MTRVSGPLFIGKQPTGNDTTKEDVAVGGLKIVELDSTTKQATRAVPPNSHLFDLNVLVSGVPTSVTQGLTIRVGTSGAPTKYGVINNVSNGFFRGSISNNALAPVSGAVVVFDVTASVSAAEFDAGNLVIRAMFVPVSAP